MFKNAGLYSSVLILAMLGIPAGSSMAGDTGYDKAHWDPIHFKPAIETATNEQCLACHQEVLEPSVREVSPAGVKASEALAWFRS